jgi:hypothetical protein
MVINREPWNMDYYLVNEFKAQPYRSAGDRFSTHPKIWLTMLNYVKHLTHPVLDFPTVSEFPG